MYQTSKQTIPNIVTACTTHIMAHKGYSMHSEVAIKQETTETAETAVGIVLI